MKSSKEKLIEFLWKKHEIIKKATGLDYITEDDIETLDNLSDIDKIWKTIKLEIIIGQYGLSTDVCPWCIDVYLNCNRPCSECFYSQKKQICNVDDETFYILKSELTPEVYKQILREIE